MRSFVVGLLSGIAVTIALFYFNKGNVTNTDRSAPVKIADQISQIQNISNKSEREEKALEMLQRIVKLMMVDISFRLKSDVAAAKTASVAQAPPSAVEQPAAVQTTSAPVAVKAAGVSAVTRRPILDVRIELKNLRTDQDRQDFLESMVITDLKQVIGQHEISRQLFVDFRGRYEGVLTPLDPSETISQMKLVFLPAPGDVVEGRTRIELSRDGKAYSSTTGKGQLRGYYSFDEKQSSILVEACGGDCSFHLFKSENSNTVFGNYYQKKNTQWLRAGTVLLN